MLFYLNCVCLLHSSRTVKMRWNHLWFGIHIDCELFMATLHSFLADKTHSNLLLFSLKATAKILTSNQQKHPWTMLIRKQLIHWALWFAFSSKIPQSSSNPCLLIWSNWSSLCIILFLPNKCHIRPCCYFFTIWIHHNFPRWCWCLPWYRCKCATQPCQQNYLTCWPRDWIKRT
jgi:hypothetical protein